MSDKKLRHKKFLKFLFIKFPLILVALGLLFYMALRMAERYPVPLREGLEEYITGLSGARASIGTLEKFSFVPKINIDFGDITLHRMNNAAEIDLSIEHVKVIIPFWSALLGQNRFQELLIENVKSEEGVLLPQAFTFEQITIIDREGPDRYGSFLVAEGTYNKKALYFEAKLNKGEKYYTMLKNTPFSLGVGDAKLNGNLERNLRTVDLKDAIFSIGDNKSTQADYVLVKSSEYIKNNPLACLIFNGDGAKCTKYLTNEKKSQ